MKFKTLIVWFFICYANNLMAQSCDESSLVSFDVRAIETDPEIPWELVKHKTYFNPECESRNLLLVHLVGSLDNPGSTTEFPSLAANCGFHVLVLKYPNLTAAQSACSQSEDTNCYEKFRLEILHKKIDKLILEYEEILLEGQLSNNEVNKFKKLIRAKTFHD